MWGSPPRGDSGHPVSGPEPEPCQAGDQSGPGCGAASASPACGPAAVVVSEWTTVSGTLPAASQPLASPVGTQTSFGRKWR